MGLSHGTHTFKGINLRLDQIQIIDPLVTKTENQDGIYAVFMKDKNLHMKSQMHFTIWFVDKGGYRDFYSKTVDYTGLQNQKVDDDFVDQYNELVRRWENYHDK